MATITVRRPIFDLADLPRRWVGGSALGTWFGNAGHVFIPLGEQFFIDAVRPFRERVGDAALRREVAAFIGQEAVHARVHESIWDELRAQEVPVDAYAALIARGRAALEPVVPAELRLAITAALEHVTAAFGRAFLDEDLEGVLPEPMAALLAWHGAEELEHRSVAYDVLAEVDDDLALRVAGMAVAVALLLVVPGTGVALFATSDLVRGRLRPGVRLPDPALLGMTARFLRRLGGELVRYVGPSFHPDADPLPASYERWRASQGAPVAG
ncbi:MAG TPA: metal-dependent hydrolase [Acidimicrobiales bacterium]|nr:metal-dependent hydrolase [Acidimicrobiales bacterium]